MKNLFLIFTLLFLATFSTQSQNLLPDSVCIELKKNIEGFKNRYHSPSITVVVVHDQEIVFSESLGYTDLENRTPASIHSMYPIMSITKPFTATMLMQLKEKGLVNLEDDVKKYVPEFKDTQSNLPKGKVTLFQLATHTSGLPRNSPADIGFAMQVDKWLTNSGKGPEITAITSSTKKEFLNSLKFVELEYPKYELLRYGDRHYSNLGYSLLGIALERAAKTSYESYVANYIFKPLKMSSSDFLTDSVKKENLVPGYWYNSITDSFSKTPVYVPNSTLYAGGIYSTANDLAKFMSFQFQNNSVEADKILSDNSKAMMCAFNIGWKPSYPFVLHEGAMLGHRCEIAFNTNLKIGWIILTNTSDFDFSRMNDIFARLITPVYAKKPITDLTQYTGTYQLKGGYGSIELYVKNDSLYSNYLSDILPSSPLIPLGNNRFNVKASNAYNIGYEFIIDEKSKKTLLNMGQLMWIKR